MKVFSAVMAVSALLLWLSTLGTAQVTKPDQELSLQWKPRVGEVHLYRINVNFDYGTGSLFFGSDLKVKVVEVQVDGSYSLQTSTANAFVQSGEEFKDLPVQPAATLSYGRTGLPKGHTLETRDTDPFSDLLDHLTEFVAPSGSVKLGDSWVNQAAGPKNGLFGQPRLSYKLVDLYREGIRHLAKIRYAATIGNDPDAASGVLVLDRLNNAVFQLDVAIPHFKPEGAADEAAVTVSVREKSAS